MKFKDETGSSIIEFAVFGLLIQGILLVFAIQISQSQAAQFAADSAARHAVRAFQISGTPAEQTANQVISEFQLKSKPKVLVHCLPDCLSEAAVFRVTVSLENVTATASGIIN